MVFALLNIIDLLTTYIGGVHNEANPIGRRLLAQYSFGGLVMSKTLLVVYFAFSTILFKRLWLSLGQVYEKLMIGTYVIVVAWNVRYLLLR